MTASIAATGGLASPLFVNRMNFLLFFFISVQASTHWILAPPAALKSSLVKRPVHDSDYIFSVLVAGITVGAGQRLETVQIG